MLGLNQISLAVNRLLGPGDDAVLNLNFLSGTLDSRITFTRASTATRYNSSGLIETVASGSPRFDHDPVTLAPRGLLIEESRTNLCLHSADLGNGVWSAPAGTLTTNQGTAPDGTSSADKFFANLALGNSRVNQLVSVATNTSYTWSVFVKAFDTADVGKRLTLYVYDTASGTSKGATTVTFTAQWQRVSTTVTSHSSGSPSFYCNLGSETGAVNETCTFLMWGAQLEAGSFPTSYIPTTSTAVTRAADSAVMTGTNFSSWYNQTEGTIVVDFWAAQTAIALSEKRVFRVDIGSGGDHFINYFDGARNLYLWNDDGGSNVNANSGTVSTTTLNKVASAIKQNDFAVSLNGAAAVADTVGTLETTMARLIIGADNNIHYLGGHIARIRYYNTRKSNSELQSLTA
jgi:hypothetical protein